MGSTLDAILDMQRQARAALEGAASWPAHAAAVAQVDALDVRALADAIVPSLLASYRAWADEEPVEAVAFEWSHSDPYACSYGFRTCRIGDPEPILGVRMPAIELDDVVFECAGFDVSPIVAISVPDRSTQFLDLLILKVAEVVHHAVAATDPPAVRILVQQHDRFPVIAF
jgi:hypothetical protein